MVSYLCANICDWIYGDFILDFVERSLETLEEGLDGVVKGRGREEY
jgi:hypothetical protein